MSRHVKQAACSLLGHFARMKDKYNKSRDRFVRATFGFIALFLTALGVFHVFTGRLTYHNAWGLGVFAPITIIVGLILLYIVIFRWSQFRESELYGNKRRKKEEDKNDLSKKHKHKHWH
jgi:uncharacterized membrane protein